MKNEILNNNIIFTWENNKKLVLEKVTKNCLKLEYVSEELRNDKEVVLVAVTQYGGLLKYTSKELRSDKEVILTALNNHGMFNIT